VRKQLSYGMQLFMAGVLGFLFEPFTKLLLAHFLGVREVGVFDIGMRARAIMSGLMLRLLYPLYPLFAKLEDPARVRALVHDVEQKSMLFVAPVLGIVVLTARPLVELFFGANVELITTTIIWMVAGYLLWSFTVTPVYLFLMAKGHASRTVIVQALNVVANAAVFFPTFGWLGYYAAVAGNVASNLTTWLLLLFLQWSLLRSLIFDTWKQILAVGVVIGLGLAFAFFSPLQHAGLYSVFLSPALMICVTILVYRFLSVVTVQDVERYLGSGTYSARVCARLLCREADPAVA
jgi:O-antigen/teichoic acid export membrane protein